MMMGLWLAILLDIFFSVFSIFCAPLCGLHVFVRWWVGGVGNRCFFIILLLNLCW